MWIQLQHHLQRKGTDDKPAEARSSSAAAAAAAAPAGAAASAAAAVGANDEEEEEGTDSLDGGKSQREREMATLQALQTLQT